MNAFIGSLVLLVGITVASAFVFQSIDMSAKGVFTSQLGSVRH
ncbi:MAG: hypothetical protein ACR2OX_04020 [Methyloligellaceae bacterium]